MKQERLNKYKKAGKILKEVKKESKNQIEPGDKLSKIAKNIETGIKKRGGKSAFPVNLSLNEIAAHYTPKIEDDTKVEKGDILTIDIGVHINGYIADSAYTLDLGNHKELTETPKKALEKAIKKIKQKGSGTQISEISSKIEYEIKKRGFKPITNLTGHGLKKYKTHTEPTIPNITSPNTGKLQKDQVIAIEPFATAGSGRVKDTSDPQIFNLKKMSGLKIRNKNARKILKEVKENYKTLPFAKRWLNKFNKLDFALKKLKQKNLIQSYSPLKERQNELVSQHEHTLIIKEESAQVIT